MKQVRAVLVVIFFFAFSILLSSHYEANSDTNQADGSDYISNKGNTTVNVEVNLPSGNVIDNLEPGESIGLPSGATAVKVLPDPLATPPAEGLKVDVRVKKAGDEEKKIDEMMGKVKYSTTPKLNLNFNLNLSPNNSYLTGPLSGTTEKPRTMSTSKCDGCSCDIYIPAKGDFALVDSIGPLNGSTGHDYDYTPYPKDVQDLVDQFFAGDMYYWQLEDKLDELGWGLDPYWGPYRYEPLKLLGFYDISYSGYGGYKSYPDTAGVQFDQFRLINPRRID